MKRQEDQWYSDVFKYLPIWICRSLSMYIYMYLPAVSLTRYIRDNVFDLQVTSCRIRGHPRQLVRVVALHEVKCGVMYWERCNWRGKRNREIVMYLSISISCNLSDYIYICTSVVSLFGFLSLSLSRNCIFYFQTTSFWLRTPTEELMLVVSLQQI
jgi:hypothetical protein